MKHSLRTKLTGSYIFISLVCISLISLFSNLMLERQFREYIQKNQLQRNQNYVSLMSQHYKGNGRWDLFGIENIGMNALEEGMILKLENQSGEVVWDATIHNKGLCNQMLAHMFENMKSRYSRWKGEYVEYRYPVNQIQTNQHIGNLQIGYYGPYYLSDNDLLFINTLNKFFVLVGIFSLAIALVLGTQMAKRVSTPISRVINKAQMIAQGRFDENINEQTNTKEISQLVSAINELASDLERQEGLRRRLTSDVAHELRTPLATLQSHIEAMIDGIWEPSKERLKSCHEEILRLSRLVKDIGELTRFESEKVELNKENFDLSELIKSVINNFEAKFIDKGVSIDFKGDKEIVNADRDKISQVVVNLISNALKYTPRKGKVTVSVRSDKDSVEIRVKDTGAGISEEDLPHIFERFYRADKSRNRMTGGSGIGLSIVKAIVEAHNGTIDVSSVVNEGSEFIINIPVSK